MSKYGEAIGYFTFKSGGAEIDIRPKPGDNLRLMRIMNKSQKNDDSFFDEMHTFIFNLIKRDVPPNTPEEENELKVYVEFNLIQLIQEIMVGFRYTTKEKLDEMVRNQEAKSLGNNPNL